MMNFLNDAQWIQLSCNQASLIDKAQDFDWTITWNALWAFLIKLLNNLLLVGQQLRRHLYGSNVQHGRQKYQSHQLFRTNG